MDYKETFYPVVKMGTIRTILAVAGCKIWPLFQLDVNNAFFHGDLVKKVYMKVPEGIPNPDNLVCLLQKSIYGLKQASRVWNTKFVTELLSQRFVQSKNDYSLFIKRHDEKICIAVVYVDDVVLTGTDLACMESLKVHLHNMFSIKDLGKLDYFLGLEVDYLDSGIMLSQQKFTKEILSTGFFDTTKPASTPLPLHVKLSKIDGDIISNLADYRSLVGKLNTLLILDVTLRIQ